MIIESIILAVAVVISAFIINGVEDYMKRGSKMSFKESMDLAELPIVTFYQGKKKLNFLLDTGSNHSHITFDASKELEGTRMKGSESVKGVGGEASIDTSIQTILEYKNNKYNINLLVGSHLDSTFADIKESTGVKVHGIIGNSFLNENKYILDFDELIAYHK